MGKHTSQDRLRYHSMIKHMVSLVCVCLSTLPSAWGMATLCADHGKIFFSPLGRQGKEVVCINQASKQILWRSTLPEKIGNIKLVSADAIRIHTDDIEFRDDDRVLILSTKNGRVLRNPDMMTSGSVLAWEPDGRVYQKCWEKQSKELITCTMPERHKALWSFSSSGLDPDSTIEARKCGDFIFIHLRADITEWTETTITATRGANEMICLRATDGSIAWRERIPLIPEATFPIFAPPALALGEKFIACAHTDTLLLLDRASGKIVQQLRVGKMIDKLLFLKQDRLMVITDGQWNPPSHIRVLTAGALALESEIILDDPGDISRTTLGMNAKVFGDTLVLSRGDGTGALNMKTLSVTWTKPYGDYDESFTDNGILAVDEKKCQGKRQIRLIAINPATGSEESLFNETFPEPPERVFLSEAEDAKRLAALPKYKSASGACPYGHRALRKVPIFYGGPLIPSPSLDKAMANLEVAWGGCCPTEEKFKTVCTRCRAEYEPNEKIWTLQTGDLQAIASYLPDIIKEFPTGDPGRLSGHPCYRQDSRTRFLRSSMIIGNEMTFLTSESKAAIKAGILKHLAAKGVKHSGFKPYAGRWGGDKTVNNIPQTQGTSRVSFYSWPHYEKLSGQWADKVLTVTVDASGIGFLTVTITVRDKAEAQLGT